MDIRRGNPGNIQLKLKARLIAMQVRGQMQRQHKCQKRNDQRKQPDVAVAAREKQQEQRPCGGDKRHQSEDCAIQTVHRLPTQTM